MKIKCFLTPGQNINAPLKMMQFEFASILRNASFCVLFAKCSLEEKSKVILILILRVSFHIFWKTALFSNELGNFFVF